MASPINVGFDLATAESKVIPLNRWARADYSIQNEGGGGTLLVEGTITQLNRRDRVTGVAPTPVWAPLVDAQGVVLSTLATGLANVDFVPLEAIRVTATGAVVGRLMQQGEQS